MEASEFRDAKKEFDKQDAVILGMSADSEKALEKFKKKYRFNFTFLSDPQHATIEAYGAWRTKKFLGRSYKGIVRSTVLIGRNAKIERIWDNVKAKGHAAIVLEAVKQNQR